MKFPGISAAILAGGRAARLAGEIKARIVVGGEMIIERNIKTLGRLFEEIIVVTNTPELFKDINGCRIVGDIYAQRGPLGGIHSALVNSNKDSVFIIASDMPFLNQSLIEKQVMCYYKSGSEAVLPVHGKGSEPLHAIYSCNLVPGLGTYLAESDDFNIRSFLAGVSVTYFKPGRSLMAGKPFTNINSPEDLAGLVIRPA